MLQDRVNSFSQWVLGLESVEVKAVDKRHRARYITSPLKTALSVKVLISSDT